MGPFAVLPLPHFHVLVNWGGWGGAVFQRRVSQFSAKVTQPGHGRAQAGTPATVGPEPALWVTCTIYGMSVSVLHTEHSAKAGARASGLMTKKTLERKTS